MFKPVIYIEATEDTQVIYGDNSYDIKARGHPFLSGPAVETQMGHLKTSQVVPLSVIRQPNQAPAS